MYFQHAPEVWRDFPELHVGALVLTGVTPSVDTSSLTSSHLQTARDRLATSSESEFPEIQAWRRTFSKMGLKPTQYRCASESLLRRMRKEGDLPRIHPLIDLCNAISVAFAIPVAAIDLDHVVDGIEVRYASGDERYQTFGGEIEHPNPGEVTFVDAAGHSHARRWTNRQSGLSAVQPTTSRVLIVAEALHDSAAIDVRALLEILAADIATIWSISVHPKVTTAAEPRIEF